jgi:arsenate reductase
MQDVRVLFLCRGNRCRSPLAEAMANGLPRRDCRLKAFSAGLAPKSVNPLVAETLTEIGLEARGLKSKHVRKYLHEPFDFVITLCGEVDEDCPVARGGRNLSVSLPDPCRPKHFLAEGDERERFRWVRDAIRAMLVAWFGPEQ